MQQPTLSHIRLLVDRFQETFRFYREVVGLPTTYREDTGPPYAEFELGGDRYLGLFDRALMAEAAPVTRERPPAAGDGAVLCIAVEDVDRQAEHLHSLGVEVLAPPTDHEPWGIRTAYVRDPEGNLIEFYSGLRAQS